MTKSSTPTTTPPRIGLFQAIGNIITCLGTTANRTTEIIDTNMQSLQVVSNTGLKYAQQFEAEADLVLTKKKAALQAQIELKDV